MTSDRFTTAALGAMPLPRGGLPLYRQLATVVREMMRDGTGDGTLITERALGERFGVSRTTVRQAMQDLAADGLVVRRQGKGTRLVGQKGSEPRPLWVFGTLDDMIAYGFETTYTLLEHGPAPLKSDVAEALRLDLATTAYRFVGIRSTGERAFALLETWLSYPIGVQAAPKLQGNSPIMALIENSLGVQVAEVEQTLTAVPATSAVSARIGVPRSRPVLLIRRLYFDADGQPIGLSINFCNPARFQYRVRLKRRASARQ